MFAPLMWMDIHSDYTDTDFVQVAWRRPSGDRTQGEAQYEPRCSK